MLGSTIYWHSLVKSANNLSDERRITMVIQPIYNILFLPDVTYHFKKEFFTENASEQLEVGSELLFAS